MKTLYYLRHSLKDANNDLSLAGIDLAKAQGQALSDIPFTLEFHGPLRRTGQTAGAFFEVHPGEVNLGTASAQSLLVPGIGNDELFKQMVTDDFKAEVKAGRPNFDALLAAHSFRDIIRWTEMAFGAVQSMMELMTEGQFAIAFGHSPMIELAVYQIQNLEIQQKFRTLKEMEGIIFVTDHPNLRKVHGIGLWDKVVQPPPPPWGS